jgi:hypothetical protein
MDWLMMNSMPDGAESRSSEHICWKGRGGDVADEDQRVLELVQRNYDREGNAFERSVDADAPTLALRRIVHAAERGAAAETLPSSRRFFAAMTARGRNRAARLDSARTELIDSVAAQER